MMVKWLWRVSIFIAAGAAGCTNTISIASTTSGSNGAGSSSGTGFGSSTGSSGTSTNGTGTGTGTGTSAGTTTGGRVPICTPACGAGFTCIFGPTDAPICVCNGGAASCPLADGGTYCADVTSDSANCGSCGTVCPALTTCVPPGDCDCTQGTVCSNDAGAPICIDVTTDDGNCGECGLSCSADFAPGSFCDGGSCDCAGVFAHLCADIPSPSGPSCSCTAHGTACAAPSFAADIYPLLAQQFGTFGCSADSCHSGEFPQADLAFREDGGQMDAGMAYAELLGIGKGNGGFDVPFCDAGVPPLAPSTKCACFSLVIPGSTSASLLSDLVTGEVPAACVDTLQGMPKDPRSGSWVPLPPCAQQLIVQWVATGAKP